MAAEKINRIHTEVCWAMPECTVCGLRKKPWGRSAPLEAANGMCDSDCEGYSQDPRPGHFWPDEEPELLTLARAGL
jgi:hypothetical protein